MPILSQADLNAAYRDGACHTQRILKNAGSSYALAWADATYASGQPAYDAHVGVPLAFTPCVAAKNDAVWFPPVPEGQHRYLHSAVMRAAESTANLVPPTVVFFDLLGFYPLIDGDSTDQQDFDNTLTLPRFADGDGVHAVLVNHVAPGLVNSAATMQFVNHAGEEKTTVFTVATNGQNTVWSGAGVAAASQYGNVATRLTNGDKGIRQINSLTFTGGAPGGLFCLYLIRILGTMVCGDNGIPTEKDFFLQHGGRMPRIEDGAWISWFSRIGSGTARTVAWFGDFNFVWRCTGVPTFET